MSDFYVEFDGERMTTRRPRLRSELVARLRERATAREDEQKRTGARGERIAMYNLRCRNDARLMREAADALEADGPKP